MQPTREYIGQKKLGHVVARGLVWEMIGLSIYLVVNSLYVCSVTCYSISSIFVSFHRFIHHILYNLIIFRQIYGVDAAQLWGPNISIGVHTADAWSHKNSENPQFGMRITTKPWAAGRFLNTSRASATP